MTEVLAVLKDTPGTGISLKRVELPALGDYDVLVKPVACGICGSDLKTYEWHSYRQPALKKAMPLIMGHEVAGHVVQVGARVTRFKPLDRVLTEPVLSCGACRLCEEGRTNICESRKVLGYETQGGMAQMAVLPAASLIKLPSSISFIDAPLLEILATAVHAIERVGLVTGQPCAVVGPGPLGIMLMQALRASGAWPVAVYGSERSRPRLELAKRLGADEIGLSDEETITRDEGRFQCAFEVAGRPEALLASARLARRGGTVVFGSGFDQVPEGLKLNAHLKNREVNLVTTTGHPRTAWDRALSLVVSGKVRIDGLVDLQVPLADADKAFQAAYTRESFKTVIICNPE